MPLFTHEELMRIWAPIHNAHKAALIASCMAVMKKQKNKLSTKAQKKLDAFTSNASWVEMEACEGTPRGYDGALRALSKSRDALEKFILDLEKRIP